MVAVLTEDVGFYKQIHEVLSEVIHPAQFFRAKLPEEVTAKGQSGVEAVVTDTQNEGVLSLRDALPNVEVFVILRASDGIPEEKTCGFHYYKAKELDRDILKNDVLYAIKNTELAERLSESLEDERKCAQKLEAELEFYKTSLAHSKELQQDVMTSSKVPEFDIAVHYEPRATISGDLFLAEESGNKVFAVMGDVTDHGYFAGLYGASIYSLIKGYLYMASKFETDIRFLAQYLLDTAFTYQGKLRSYTESETATIVIAEIDKKKNRVSFVSCGHGDLPPIILPKDGAPYFVWDVDSPEIVRKQLRPVGSFSTEPQTIEDHIITCPFNEGDTLVLYTDGATEVFRSSHDTDYALAYSAERLLSRIGTEIKSKAGTPESILKAMEKDLASFSVSKRIEKDGESILGNIRDDITIAVMQWKESDLRWIKKNGM